MKAADVVLQLAKRLPRFTDKFTTNLSVNSISATQLDPETMEVTVETTTDHGLAVSRGVNIVGAETPIEISSFTRVGSIGTIVTATDHDFTFGKNGAISGSGKTNAIVSGANEANFNGSFKITGVSNRRTIQVDIDDSGATSATGSVIIENAYSPLQTFNGLYAVASVPSSTTFTYQIKANGLLDPVGTIEVRGNARISSAIDVESIEAAYTEQSPNDLWAFVILGDVISSKDRKIMSDATENLQRSNYYRQQTMQNMSIYVVIPTALQQIASRAARDDAEEIFKYICQSVLFHRFDNYLYSGKQNTLSFLSHGQAISKPAYYIHEYAFQQVADILFEDTVGYDEDVAFRDIDFTQTLDVGTGVNNLTASIDLDEVAL